MVGITHVSYLTVPYVYVCVYLVLLKCFNFPIWCRAKQALMVMWMLVEGPSHGCLDGYVDFLATQMRRYQHNVIKVYDAHLKKPALVYPFIWMTNNDYRAISLVTLGRQAPAT